MVLEGHTLSPLAMQREVDVSLPRRACVYVLCMCVYVHVRVCVLSRWRQMRYGSIVGTVCLDETTDHQPGISRNDRR